MISRFPPEGQEREGNLLSRGLDLASYNYVHATSVFSVNVPMKRQGIRNMPTLIPEWRETVQAPSSWCATLQNSLAGSAVTEESPLRRVMSSLATASLSSAIGPHRPSWMIEMVGRHGGNLRPRT